MGAVTKDPFPSHGERMPVRDRIPFELTGSEVPTATFVDELVPVASGGAQAGSAIRASAEKQCDATLRRIDAVDGDFVIDGDQPLFAAVERCTQIGEFLTVAGETCTRVPECRDPASTIAVGIASVVSCGQIEDRIASCCAVEYVLLLIGHGHLFSPCLTG